MAGRYRVLLILAAGGCMAGFAAPAHAQARPEAEIDRIVDASQGVSPALSLARRQIAEDDLVAAAATLERLLVDHPEAADALLLHASLLCRLDDRAGSRAELAGVRGGSDAGWAEVRAACGPAPRSGRK